jgi:hypothetical protein
MLLRKLVASAVITGATFMSGCASINKAPAALDAEAKQFTPNPNHAQVYVYRNESFGGAISMPVTVDGKSAGNTGPKSYFKFNLPEGKHVITSQGDKSTLNIETENNKNYYVWQEVKMGALSAGSHLQVVDETKGQAGVKECTLIQSNF